MKKRITILSLLVLLLSIFGIDTDLLNDEAVNFSTDVLSDSEERIRVTRVIDGDTVELENGTKVRYIGIDTPEIRSSEGAECFSYRAKEENSRLVLGKLVRLEKDISETDRYGRKLRYVYVSEESSHEVFVNKFLVEQGYAYAASFPPDIAYQVDFADAQQTAMENNSGLWNECN